MMIRWKSYWCGEKGSSICGWWRCRSRDRHRKKSVDLKATVYKAWGDFFVSKITDLSGKKRKNRSKSPSMSVGFFKRAGNIGFMRIACFFRKIGRWTFLEKMGWNKENLRVWYVKKLIKSVVLHYLWGIDTNIWFRNNSLIVVLHYLWGIDTSLVVLPISITLCFTLPMRNWHFISFMLSPILIFVLHYLWGIDTFFTLITKVAFSP